jgi:PKHD-type hydroxylase
MHVILEDVLAPGDVAAVRAMLQDIEFLDGRSSSTLQGKRNLQAAHDNEAAARVAELVLNRLAANERFQIAVQPRYIHPPLLSLYGAAMEYPEHVDCAVMGGRRADVAMTVFISDPDTYDGGELVIAEGGDIRYRLPAGHAIAYPASTLHRVSPVTRGERLAVVLWAESTVRDPARRQILFDLARATERLEATPYGGRLRRAYWNLVRLWAET